MVLPDLPSHPPQQDRLRAGIGRYHTSGAALVAAVALLALAASVGTAVAATGFAPAGTLSSLGAGRIWDLAIDPAQPSLLLAATDAGVYSSSNSGASWRASLPGVRVWTVGFDARTPANAFAGTAGEGVYASTDSGSTWAASVTGLPNLDVRSLAFGLDGIAAGTDSGVAVSPDGHTWHSAGLGGFSIAAVAVAANSPQFTLIAGADTGSLATGSVFESSGGGPWQPLQAGLPASAVVSSLAAGPVDAAVPKRPLVVTTGKGVFRSGDGGATWTASTGVPDQLTLTTAVFDPLDPNVVYAGADAASSSGGNVLRSVDGGQSFAVANTGLPASKNVEAIAIAPTNPLVVAVAIDPPTGAASVWTEADATVPAPPQLLPEAPGAAVPTVVATPSPTAAPPQTGPLKPLPATPSPGGLQRFTEAAFHWPTPLLYEVFLVLLAVYVFIRWRQRYYVEGPP